ncbi:NADP-dependent oxidoreductase [Arthrobacter sp. JSM 101049]|uniref:NADP-dependent oxidoreductase n=1 Tax=Arthrobacter sp. JSM 101049 TaxID=929097 RepID=UPI003566980B
MTAIQITQYGPLDQLVVAETSGPTGVGEGQLLVRVAAASINPVDAGIAEGAMADAVQLELPFTLGGDYSGIVEKIGPGVEGFAVGDAVIGQASVVLGGTGSFADRVVAPSMFAAHAPRTVPLIEAASLPLVGASAVQALGTLAPAAGHTVLVLGGGGSIGSIAVQLARAAGARVIASAAAADLDFVTSMGADEVHDYANDSWLDGLSGIDAILDASPGVEPTLYYPVLRPGGAMVSLLTQHDAGASSAAGVAATTQMTMPIPETLGRLVQAVDAGQVTLRIAATVPLERAAEGFEIDVTTAGKVLLVAQK